MTMQYYENISGDLRNWSFADLTVTVNNTPWGHLGHNTAILLCVQPVSTCF